MTFGVFFVATGAKHLEELLANISLSAHFYDGINISLATDCVDIAESSGFFENIYPLDSPSFSYRDKILGLQYLPYDYTLFLDSDCKPSFHLKDIFNKLTAFDIAGCHAPVRIPPGWSDYSIPSFFPEINTGVLFLRNCSLVVTLLSEWLVLYDQLLDQYSQTWDQASFRSVLWNKILLESLSFLVLPCEFNLRTTKAWIAGRGLQVYLVHGRFPDHEWDDFLLYLNSNIDRVRSSYEWSSLNPLSEIRARYDNTFS